MASQLDFENNASLKRIATALEKLVTVFTPIEKPVPVNEAVRTEKEVLEYFTNTSGPELIFINSQDLNRTITGEFTTDKINVKSEFSVVKDVSKKKIEHIEIYNDYSKYKTKAEKILRYIEDSGKEGRMLKEIQTFIIRLRKPNHVYNWHNDRGMYCINLYGGSGRKARQGLFAGFCSKNAKGKWYITSTICKPFYT